jgi:hypothetical protein
MGTGVAPPQLPPGILSKFNIRIASRQINITLRAAFTQTYNVMDQDKIDQASRPISTGQLNVLLRLHLLPINLLVLEEP